MKLVQRLGAFDATMIIAGSMIGSGIFVAPSIMAGWIQSPGVLLGLWIFGGIFTILGALSCAELATMFPKAGGQYVYLREAFGPFAAFLFGWTQFLVVQTGFIAAVSIAFAKFLGVFLPQLGEQQILFTASFVEMLPALDHPDVPMFLKHYTLSSAQLVACGVILVLTLVNIRGVREGAFVQNLFTVTKIGALVVLAVVGLAMFGGNTEHFVPIVSTDLGKTAILEKVGFGAALAVALSKALFAYDAWNTVTFVSEEVREPKTTLPRSLLLGSGLVMLVYVLTIASFLAVMSMSEMADVKESRVGQAVAAKLFGKLGEAAIIVAILISTFGCVNGLILSGARVSYAMAREGHFFRSCDSLHPVRATPVAALVLQAIWSAVLTLTGSFDALLTYTTFASVLFAALMILGVFWLRWTRPDADRPYRCWGYPLPPMLYLAIAIPFLVYVIRGDPMSTGIGLLIVASGVPAYLMWRK